MYIYQSSCISPQHTFAEMKPGQLVTSEENILRVIEPKYEGIPLNILRRMGKAVRMGVGASMPLINTGEKLDGIIIGTANGGMEDCIKFLNQIIQYDEGRLTPTNFVQSTPNAIAAQIGLTTINRGYNVTHVHRGLAFENSLMDTMMKLREHQEDTYLVGGVDEISDYNYNIENLGGWYKKEKVKGTSLYRQDSPGSIAGEGVAMFVCGNERRKNAFRVRDMKMLHSSNDKEVREELIKFMDKNSEGRSPDIFLSGENGDNRLTQFYESCENVLDNNTLVARFKHFTGEFPTASALALWLAGHFLTSQSVPEHFIKSGAAKLNFQDCLIYNNYKGQQHGLIYVSFASD